LAIAVFVTPLLQRLGVDRWLALALSVAAKTALKTAGTMATCRARHAAWSMRGFKHIINQIDRAIGGIGIEPLVCTPEAGIAT